MYFQLISEFYETLQKFRVTRDEMSARTV